MENASKALLMAGGVLIGILILSLAVYLFTTFGATSARVQNDIETQRIVEFNVQFTSHEGKQVTIHDIITLANLAKENNEYYKDYAGYADNYEVKVFCIYDYGSNIELSKEIDKDEIIGKYGILSRAEWVNDDGELHKFEVTKIDYHGNGRIKLIKFKQID